MNQEQTNFKLQQRIKFLEKKITVLYILVSIVSGTHPNSETLRVYAQRCYEFIVK